MNKFHLVALATTLIFLSSCQPLDRTSPPLDVIDISADPDQAEDDVVGDQYWFEWDEKILGGDFHFSGLGNSCLDPSYEIFASFGGDLGEGASLEESGRLFINIIPGEGEINFRQQKIELTIDGGIYGDERCTILTQHNLTFDLILDLEHRLATLKNIRLSEGTVTSGCDTIAFGSIAAPTMEFTNVQLQEEIITPIQDGCKLD